MQNRYTGDIGDYIKLALLRALSPGMTLGVAWWLYPDQLKTQDGRHTHYLTDAVWWRAYDCALFDSLAEIVASGTRHVTAIENAQLIPGAIFHSEQIPTRIPFSDRITARASWFERLHSDSRHSGNRGFNTLSEQVGTANGRR